MYKTLLSWNLIAPPPLFSKSESDETEGKDQKTGVKDLKLMKNPKIFKSKN